MTQWSTRIPCDLKAARLYQVANSVVESLLLSRSRKWQGCFVDYQKTSISQLLKQSVMDSLLNQDYAVRCNRSNL